MVSLRQNLGTVGQKILFCFDIVLYVELVTKNIVRLNKMNYNHIVNQG